MTDDAGARARFHHQTGAMLLDGFDFVWSRVRGRLDGLTQDEYLWEPVPGCWSVRPDGAGGWQVDLTRPEPQPAPVTTIAWRIWHIAAPCLAGYTVGGLGPWPLTVTERQWHPAVPEALAELDRAWDAFRGAVGRMGEDELWRPLGPGWGPYATDPWAGLVLHAFDEVAHHGAEIALLRDLYAHRGQGSIG